MKILVLTFYYKPDICAGSFRATPFVNALSNLLTLDDKIEVITTMPQRYFSFDQEANEIEEFDNVQIKRIKLPSHHSRFLDQSWAFFHYMAKTLIDVKKKKYDVVFATSSRLFTAFMGALIARNKNIPLYLDIRDIFTDNLSSVLKNKVTRVLIFFLQLIEKYTINSATKINLVSKGFKTYFENINDKVDYSFLTNGIDNEFLNFDFTKSRTNGKIIITYAGNIGEGQGLEKIVPNMALSLGDNYEIRIIGAGGMRSVLEKRLQKCNIGNVKIYDPVDREKLLRFYKNTDYLLLHLNNYDAFKRVLPSKIFEYGATRKPTIAGVSGYAAKFINKYLGHNWLVFEPANIQDFERKFHNFEPGESDIKSFLDRFNRKTLMSLLAKDVIGVVRSFNI